MFHLYQDIFRGTEFKLSQKTSDYSVNIIEQVNY
jgi:hypothetical protein